VACPYAKLQTTTNFRFFRDTEKARRATVSMTDQRHRIRSGRTDTSNGSSAQSAANARAPDACSLSLPFIPSGVFDNAER
jgi:hypothetical protein